MILRVVGGVGIFLLGMVLLTDGLKGAAGSALRRTLERFTGGRVPALLSGVAVTALVQSSSATILATIGFVSAGLLTFPAAVGVIFGANLGTSSTGWIVSLLGLKLKIGTLALPLVGVGALLRLMGRGRGPHLGTALAGFGLIFVGIDFLQEGMTDLSERLDPARVPVVGVGGRMLLVGLGVGMTVVMQSSSAAVATTLTALHSGAITLEQGALLVIGQNVGTTVTAGIASIGASVPARRTALAHVLFNVLTGAVAFLILPQLLRLDGLASTWMDLSEPAVALAAFHTTFNLLGVLLLLPVVDHFSRMVERMVPERGPVLGRHLDRSLLGVPGVAVAAARRAVAEVAAVTAPQALAVLEGATLRRSELDAIQRAHEALGRIRTFLRQVESAPESVEEFTRHLSVLHALDHQDRLVENLLEVPPPEGRRDLAALSGSVRPAVELWTRWLEKLVDPARGEQADGDPGGAAVRALEVAAAAVAEARRAHRVQMLARTAAGGVTPEEAQLRMAAVRWGDRLVYHLWRTAVHLGGDGVRSPGEAPRADEAGAGAYVEVEG